MRRAVVNRAAKTIGDVAEHYQTRIHRVKYAIETRGIEPSGWVGNLRVFDDEAVERIGRALAEMDEARGGR